MVVVNTKAQKYIEQLKRTQFILENQGKLQNTTKFLIGEVKDELEL